MKRIILRKTAFLVTIIALSGCARTCQKLERNTSDNKPHDIKVTLYSGGEEIRTWEFFGIVNSSKDSDGYYFYYNEKLVEVSGDVVIEYLDN